MSSCKKTLIKSIIIHAFVVTTVTKFRESFRYVKKYFQVTLYSRAQNSTYPYYETLCKWGDFERAKTTLKMLLASWFFKCFFKRFRSFNVENVGSVGQRAAKLLAVKVGGLKKKSANWPQPHSNHLTQIWLHPGRTILKLWQLLTFKPFNLQTSYLQQ